MVNGIRRVSIERGYDPRDFVLIGAGGATALHVTALAKEISIRTVLVPKLASGLCAFGQISSDVNYNYMAATPVRLDMRADLDCLEQRSAELESQGVATLQSEGITRDCIAFKRSIDMRYVGQVHECSVDIGSNAVSARTIEGIKAALHQLHKQLFTYDEADSLIEIVNIEATVCRQNRVAEPRATARRWTRSRGDQDPPADDLRRQFGGNRDTGLRRHPARCRRCGRRSGDDRGADNDDRRAAGLAHSA